MHENFPIGSIVYLDDPAETFEVVGYRRNQYGAHVALLRNKRGQVHAPASSLTAVPTPESLGIDPTQDGWFTEYLKRTS